jgi:hypothetical protein
MAAILALALGLVVGSDRYRAQQLLLVVGWSGTAYALYGILNSLIEPTMILWRGKHPGAGNVTGTFINENTSATYFGSCAPPSRKPSPRAGVTVSMLTLVAAFTAYFRRDLPKRSSLALLVESATGVVLLFVQLLGGGVNQHFDTKGLSDE